MAEIVGSKATSSIPQETNALLQQLVYELRVLQYICAAGMNVPDDIERLRSDLKTMVETVTTP